MRLILLEAAGQADCCRPALISDSFSSQFQAVRIMNSRSSWHGGIDKVPDAVSSHCIQEAERVDDIVLVILQGLPNRLLHLDGGGEVDYGLGPESRQDIVQENGVGQVAPDEAAVKDGPVVARGEVFVDEEIMACLAERLDDVAADVTGSSGDEYLHVGFRNPWERLLSACFIRGECDRAMGTASPRRLHGRYLYPTCMHLDFKPRASHQWLWWSNLMRNSALPLHKHKHNARGSTVKKPQNPTSSAVMRSGFSGVGRPAFSLTAKKSRTPERVLSLCCHASNFLNF